MIVQEPVQAAIWHCLNHYAFQDATFLAERLCSEVETDDTIFLLATCYYRSGQVHQAHWLLSSKKIQSPQCRFLLAKCAFELKEYYAAEMALTLDYPLKAKSLEGITREFGEIACFALQLIARICAKSERVDLAAGSHKQALKLNPFLWQSFTELCHLQQNDEPAIDPDQIFQFTNDTFQTCQSQNSYLGVREATAGVNIDTLQVPAAPLSAGHAQNASQLYSPSLLTTPVEQIMGQNHPPAYNNIRAIPFDATTPNSGFITPQENVVVVGSNIGGQKVPPPVTAKKQFRLMSNFSPMTPSFGVMLLTSPLVTSNNATTTTLTTTPQTPQLLNDQNEAPVVVAKKIRSHNNANNSIKRKDSPLPESKFLLNQVNNITNVRRSSRLFSSNNNYSVKENNSKQAEQANNLLNKTPKSPMRKSKQRITSKLNSTAGSLKPNNLNSSLGELNEKATAGGGKGPLIEDAVRLETTTTTGMVVAPMANAAAAVDHQQMLQHVLNLKRESVEGLMTLLRELGRACRALDRFNCRDALEIFRALPPQHMASSWVQSQIALAHHELHEYEAAARIFKEVHRKEPHRLHLMEIYSTALWHLQREVELSALAHDLMAQDKNSPVTWCVTGNCFSLHKEHDVAIKFFQRAVQVDAEFVYSYILLGHEFVITEELEKAMSCFRTAINKEFRHYNAWFGIGTIYSKQEKFQQAELYYARALKINPRNSVILVHIGAMQLFSKQMEQALKTLNAAIRLEPKNPLGKFHRSRLYFATKRYEEALAELEELKEIVPKESVIYYLIGKIHKQMGNFDLGLMHFSWASDLDPKGANNQIKESFDSTTAATAGASGINTSTTTGGGAGADSVSSAGGGGLADHTGNTSSANNNSNYPIDEEDEDEDGVEVGLDEDVTGGDEEADDDDGDDDFVVPLERGLDIFPFGEPASTFAVGRTYTTTTSSNSSSSVVQTPVTTSGGAATTSSVHNNSMMTPVGTGGQQSGGGNAVTTNAPTAPTTLARFTEASTGMDTPRTWNTLNYDSDSF